jgi:hypothetical protein
VAEAAREASSHLFMVRVWQEEVADGRVEWRGKVQYVSDVEGQVHYFRDWTALAAWLQKMLPVSEA